MACPNGAEPLLLPIENVTVSESGKAIARGIAIGLGNPQQILSLLPTTSSDDLFVTNVANCGDATNDTCVGTVGGVFSPGKSSSYVLTTKGQWNGTKDYDVDGGSYIFFNDDLRYGEIGAEPGYPAYMNEPGYTARAGLPLGANSTFLDSVLESKQAPSRVFGMYVGSRSLINPHDGLLTIGGYDTARVDGEFTTFPTFDDCATCVVVKNITWVWEGGSTSLFANDSEILQIGLEPFTKSINLPQHMFEKFIEASLGTFDPDLELITYPVDAVPQGNITVTLSNGYETTILGDELFSKPRLYNENGTYEISNETVTIGLVNNLTTAGYVATWGMPYLTMNYLLMDHDHKKFKMAKAVRGDFGVSGGALISTICGPESVPTGNNGTGNSPNINAGSDKHSGGSDAGAIAGGVVGGILGLALIICGFGYLFWRANRKKKNQQQHPEMQHQSHYGGTTAGARSDAGDARASIFTSTAPTEYSELASPQQQYTSANGSTQKMPSVNSWLMSQNSSDEKPQMSATLNGPEPLEMPGDHYHAAGR